MLNSNKKLSILFYTKHIFKRKNYYKKYKKNYNFLLKNNLAITSIYYNNFLFLILNSKFKQGKKYFFFNLINNVLFIFLKKIIKTSSNFFIKLNITNTSKNF